MSEPSADYERPWDDPDDPAPEAFDAGGRWTAAFVDWAKRSGHRRWLYYFGPGGVLEGKDRTDA